MPGSAPSGIGARVEEEESTRWPRDAGPVTAGQRKEQGLVRSLEDRGERTNMGSVGAGSCREAMKREIRGCPG